MVENYLGGSIVDLLALLILAVFVAVNQGLLKKRKRLYLVTVFTAIVVIVAEAGTVLFEKSVYNQMTLHIACNILGFVLTPVIPMYLAFSLRMDLHKKQRYLMMIPCLFNLMASALSPFTIGVFHIEADNSYSRGSLFWIFVVTYFLGMLALLQAILIMSKRHQYRVQARLTMLYGFILAGTTFQLVVPQIHTAWHCVTIALVLCYGQLCELDEQLDPLTRVFNRRAYEAEVRFLSDQKEAVVVMLDVDDFKLVNDSFGHGYGDYSLKMIAAVVQKAFYKQGSCYRIGGDEFSVLCEKVEEEKLNEALQYMSERIEKIREHDPRFPTVSYGCRSNSSLSGHGGLQSMISEADEEMYFYKNKRKMKKEQKKEEMRK